MIYVFLITKKKLQKRKEVSNNLNVLSFNTSLESTIIKQLNEEIQKKNGGN